MIPPRLVTAIDNARRMGMSHAQIAKMIQQAGLKDVQGALAEYMALPAQDGTPRLRGEVNPGDPADPSRSTVPYRP